MQVKRDVIFLSWILLDLIWCFIFALYLLFHKCVILKYTLQHIGRNTPPSVIFCLPIRQICDRFSKFHFFPILSKSHSNIALIFGDGGDKISKISPRQISFSEILLTLSPNMGYIWNYDPSISCFLLIISGYLHLFYCIFYKISIRNCVGHIIIMQVC